MKVNTIHAWEKLLNKSSYIPGQTYRNCRYRGKPADIFYLDFAKAFDEVPKARLLQKLRTQGISGNILNWIENWLTDERNQ